MLMASLVYCIGLSSEIFLFFSLFFQKECRIPIKKNFLIASAILGMWVITTLAGFDWRIIGVGPLSLQIILIFTALGFVFQITPKELILVGIGEWLALSLAETVIIIWIAPLEYNSERCQNIVMLILSVILLIGYLVFGRRKILPPLDVPKKTWIYIDIIMFILTTLISFFQYTINQDPVSGINLNKPMMNIGRGLLFFGGFSILILLFIMMYNYKFYMDFRRQKELAEIEMVQQKEYFQNLLQREEETRRFRHDIINDLIEIKALLNQKRYDQVNRYIESTLGVAENISKSSFDVGNDIVNIVINYYLQPLKDKYSINVNGYMTDSIRVEDRDLCVLSANMLKNAVEAVKKTSQGIIYVETKVGKDYLYVLVKNSYKGQIVFDKKGMPITSKRDKRNHGNGMRNIADTVLKYKGQYEIHTEKEMFSIEVYIPV